MNSTARGLMRPEGAEPALDASTASPPCMRANASAIWLRFAFSTHTNRTRFFMLDVRSSTAPRARRAAGRALVHLRFDRAQVGAAARAVRRAGCFPFVVGGRL